MVAPFDEADPADLAWLVEACTPIVERFGAAGHQIYLVGGIVRDLAAGRDVRRPDLDFTTDARPDQTVAVLDGWVDALWRQGERFGTIGARRGPHEIEITTFRADVYDPESRKPVVSFGDHIHDDLARRDFTVNAMALSLPEGELVDPFDGLADLRARRLVTPLAAEVSFSDDPLRMLRAARFAAGYDLRPDPELVGAATAMAGRMEIVSVERTRDELVKLLALSDPTAGIELLVRTGVAVHCLPELDAAGVDARLDALAALRRTAPHPLTRLVVLLVSLDGSAGAGARVAARLAELRSSSAEVASARRLAEAVLTLDGPLVEPGGGAERSTVRRRREVLAAIGGELDALVEVLVGLDRRDEARALRELAAAEPDLLDGRPLLDGATVMARFGLEPGPEVGRALRIVSEARLDRGPLTTEEAVAVLDAALGDGGPPRS